MAIDRTKAKSLMDEIEQLLDQLLVGPSGRIKQAVIRGIMGPAFEEIRKFILESRPPILYLIGRSGHGKSSLINALANREVASVGDIKPTTAESIPYTILFEEVFSSWTVVDSRGLFETTKPPGASAGTALEQVKRDLKKYKPDVILHVISAPEVRALEQDLRAFGDLSQAVKTEMGVWPPTLVVLNKVDTLGNPRDWPPEKSARKAGLIKELLDYMADEVLQVKTEPLDVNKPIGGVKVRESNYMAIVPVSSLAGETWNIETLSFFIGDFLPESTRLDYYQAQRRKPMLRQLSTSLIKRFATIAGGVGSVPVPLPDIAILTPLQLMMIVLIGGLSCRPFSKKTAMEFLTASGLNVGAAFGLREVARQLVKFIPGFGAVVSGAVAGTATYGLGKTAEAYFFAGEIRKPEEFTREWGNGK